MTDAKASSTLGKAGWELVRALARRYRAVHTVLGMIGNTAFLVGSVFFLYESLKRIGTWLFIVGALGMLIGSIGSALVQWKSSEDADGSQRRSRNQEMAGAS
ncbi:MAG: YrhK family protein [Microthrixaceae bacterium]